MIFAKFRAKVPRIYIYILFFYPPADRGKIKLKLTTLPRVFIHKSCADLTHIHPGIYRSRKKGEAHTAHRRCARYNPGHPTGRFKLRARTVFPGERPSRFLDSDRETLRTSSMCPCEALTCHIFLFFFCLNLCRLRYFGRCGPPWINIFRRKNKTRKPPPEPRPQDGHVGRVCKISGSISHTRREQI